MGKALAYILGGVGIVATIIGFWDLPFVISILVKVIVIACVVGLIVRVAEAP